MFDRNQQFLFLFCFLVLHPWAVLLNKVELAQVVDQDYLLHLELSGRLLELAQVVVRTISSTQSYQVDYQSQPRSQIRTISSTQSYQVDYQSQLRSQIRAISSTQSYQVDYSSQLRSQIRTISSTRVIRQTTRDS